MHVKHIEREFEKNNDSIHRVITHDHMLHRTGLWTEAQVRGSKAR